jgi:hypothetical protein
MQKLQFVQARRCNVELILRFISHGLLLTKCPAGRKRAGARITTLVVSAEHIARFSICRYGCDPVETPCIRHKEGVYSVAGTIPITDPGIGLSVLSYLHETVHHKTRALGDRRTPAGD